MDYQRILPTWSSLRPGAHRTRTSFLHCSLSLVFLSSSLHVWPISFISDSTVLLQVVFGQAVFLLPSGVHLRDTLVMLFVGFLSTCPIHSQRYLLRIVRMLVELVISCRFSFEISNLKSTDSTLIYFLYTI